MPEDLSSGSSDLSGVARRNTALTPDCSAAICALFLVA